MGGKGSGRKTGDGGKHGYSELAKAVPSHESAAKAMELAKRLLPMEPPAYDEEQGVIDRFGEYLAVCDEVGVRPLVHGWCTALGLEYGVYLAIVSGEPGAGERVGVTPSVKRLLKKIHQFLATAWEAYIASEQGNPAKWIFLGKNFFGMRDQTEHVRITYDATPQTQAPEEVIARYQEQLGVQGEGGLAQALPEPRADAGGA